MAHQTLKSRVREDFIAKYSYILQKSSGEENSYFVLVRIFLKLRAARLPRHR